MSTSDGAPKRFSCILNNTETKITGNTNEVFHLGRVSKDVYGN